MIGVIAAVVIGGGGGSAPLQSPGAYDSLTESVVAVARLSHAGLRALAARVQAAESEAGAAGLVTQAVLRVEVEEFQRSAEAWQPGQINALVEGELFAGRRRAARRSLAAAEAATARAEYLAAVRIVEAAVRARVESWLGNLAVAGRLAVMDSLLSDAEQLIVARFGQGAASYVEVLRVRAERLRVRTEQAGAVSEAVRDRLLILAVAEPDTGLTRRLSTLLGPPAGDPSQRFDPARLPPLLPHQPAIGPDLVAPIVASLSVRGERLRALAQAEARPAVLGFLGLQRFQDDLEASRIGLSAGASISLPFTASGQRRAAARTAALEADALTLEGVALSAWQHREQNRLRARYQAEREMALVYQTTLLTDLRAEREAALNAYRAGAFGLFELLDFERALVRADIDRISIVGRAMQTWYHLSSGVPPALADAVLIGGTP